MPLLEFIPLPMVFNFSGNVSVTPEVGPNNMIAVGHSNAYQIISIFGSSLMQQDGGDLFLQREESPPDRPHQDLPRITVPGRPGQHPDTLPVLNQGGA